MIQPVIERKRTVSSSYEGSGAFSADQPSPWSRRAAAEEALQLMARHQVRRLPVVENGRLVGIVAQADIALKE
jgi:signal-transduction protein with cAMP-binding, CBS, and nucleotidyltransferase domain